MLPPSVLPEMLAQSSLDRYAHSALPGAPVRVERAHRRLAPRTSATLRRGGARLLRRRPLDGASATPLVTELERR